MSTTAGEAIETADLDEDELRRPQIEQNQAAIAVLETWLSETDPEVIREERETLEYLMRALDEHRTYRKLFS